MTDRNLTPATPASRVQNGLCCNQRVVAATFILYRLTPVALPQLKEAQA
jgi:hypothetical protein